MVTFNQNLLEPFENRLQKIDRHRGKRARRQELDCYRVFDFDLPEFPLVVDRYADHLYVAAYRNKGPRWLSESPEVLDDWVDWCLPSLVKALNVEVEKIHIKQRRKKGHAGDQYQKTGDRRQFFPVEECGLKFWVNLTDYLDTGLFLDHRDTRALVRQTAAQARVLNLFCYTGSFSVYAADGNAAQVTSVDLSRTYLDWARDNMELNRLYQPEKHEFIRADVLEWLEQGAAESFDLIVMDPPTFSNSKSMESHLDIQRDHAGMIQSALRLLARDGVLIFSTNYRKFQLAEQEIQASRIHDLTRQTTPFDFQGKMKRWCYRLVK